MSNPRLQVRSKFLFKGEKKVFLQGVTYGPFRPHDEKSGHFKTLEQTRLDFELMRQAGFNSVRVYHVPPVWLMDLAQEYALGVWITVPWHKRVLFLDDRAIQRETRLSIRQASKAHAGHPAMHGFFVDNEIPADLVRWYGPERIERFLDSLVMEAKSQDSGVLCSYANFPPTEYLLPSAVDFYSYNVYLHQRIDLNRYLARLQNLAEDKPLIISEFGMDTIRHPEQEQAELLEMQLQEVAQGGLAGTFYFSWTDEWFTDGVDVEDWAFGIVRKDRTPKPAYHALAQRTLSDGATLAKKFPLTYFPKVSVVVCSYNGAPTLRACLESLRNLNYPDYEVIFVDDGSNDHTQEIVKDFPEIVNIRQQNMGLSVARNVGIHASQGEVVAFTDSDCMADKDWLYYLVHTLLSGDFVAVGGPNVSPPALNPIQAAVAASPGSPSHVLITDTVAEHVPGCNMAYYKWALLQIDGFDAQFRKAGDDVDVCWRLMQLGYQIGFSPSAVVWHYRRFTVDAFFKQQRGYGEAESMLRYKHLQYFDSAGSARWKGVIYGQPRFSRIFQRPIIYHGVFGLGFFQCIYPRRESEWSYLISSLEWVGLMALIFLMSFWVEPLRIVPLIMLGVFLIPPLSFMIRARIDPKYDTLLSRFLVFYLAVAQPLVREWARYFTWLKGKSAPSTQPSKAKSRNFLAKVWTSHHLCFWSEKGLERTALLKEAVDYLEQEDWKYALDNGWSHWDVQILANRWWNVELRTLSEIYPHGRRATRVNLELEVSKFSVLTIFLCVVGILLLAISKSLWLSHVIVVFALLLALWIWWGLEIRYRIADVIVRSAVSIGMDVVKSQKA